MIQKENRDPDLDRLVDGLGWWVGGGVHINLLYHDIIPVINEHTYYTVEITRTENIRIKAYPTGIVDAVHSCKGCV